MGLCKGSKKGKWVGSASLKVARIEINWPFDQRGGLDLPVKAGGPNTHDQIEKGKAMA
jgi:hypothetical protein